MYYLMCKHKVAEHFSARPLLDLRVIRAATVRERKPAMVTSPPSRSRLGFGGTRR